MTERRDDLIDETYLRRSLRLETDERAPRFDAQAIAALAAHRPRTALALSLGATGAAITALVAFAVWSLVLGVAPAFIDAVATTALEAVVSVITFLAPFAQDATQPVIPLSVVAALGVAIFHEIRERREPVDAIAS